MQCARQVFLPASDFCEHYLGLSYSQARSDLDHWIPHAATEALSTITGLGSQSIIDLEVPHRHMRSAFDTQSRTFGLPVAYCPLCLKDEPYARRSWRSRLAAVCTKHGAELSTRCDACGSQVPYFGSWLGLAPHYWLELGPVCPLCAGRLDEALPIPAPAYLHEANCLWNEALQPCRVHQSEADCMLRATLRLVEIARASREIIEIIRTSGYKGSWPAHAAAAAVAGNYRGAALILRLHYAAMRPEFFASCVANLQHH